MGSIISSIFGSSDLYGKSGLFIPDDVTKYYGDKFYVTAPEYWKKQDNTNSGMLAGFTYTHKVDVKYSKEIVEKYIKQHNLGTKKAVDFGAGIGRITLNVLGYFFEEVDLVEPVGGFLSTAKKSLNEKFPDLKVNLHVCGAQNYEFGGNYDLFWVQWTLMYLTDDDCVKLLKNCKEHLSPNGKIVVKENGIPELEQDWRLAQWSPADHSFARSRKAYHALLEKAGLKIIEDNDQPEWDSELLPVFVFVLE